MSMNQTHLLGWLQYYDMIYQLDEVERPPDRIIENDEKMDRWYDAYRANVRKQLEEYHKNKKTPHADKPFPKPRRGFLMGHKK